LELAEINSMAVMRALEILHTMEVQVLIIQAEVIMDLLLVAMALAAVADITVAVQVLIIQVVHRWEVAVVDQDTFTHQFSWELQ
jgi:hypothetical protein